MSTHLSIKTFLIATAALLFFHGVNVAQATNNCLSHQLFSHELNGKTFAAKLQNQTIRIKSGEILHLKTELSDDSFVSIDILDHHNRSVGRAWRLVQNGDIGGGGTFINGDTERNKLAELLDEVVEVAFATKAPQFSKKFDLDYEINYATRQLSAMHFSDKKGNFKGSFHFKNNKLTKAEKGDAHVDDFGLLQSFITENHLSIQKKAFQKSLAISNFDRLSHERDLSGQGVASALFSAFAKISPERTALSIEANNRETVRRLNQTAARLMETPEYLKLPASEQKDWIHTQLIQTARQSKWGRVLENSGWLIYDLMGQPGDTIFYLDCLRK